MDLNNKLIITAQYLSVRLSIDKEGFLAIAGFNTVSVKSPLVDELLLKAVPELGC